MKFGVFSKLDLIFITALSIHNNNNATKNIFRTTSLELDLACFLPNLQLKTVVWKILNTLQTQTHHHSKMTMYYLLFFSKIILKTIHSLPFLFPSHIRRWRVLSDVLKKKKESKAEKTDTSHLLVST